MDLTEAGDFKRRWQGYTKEFHKNDLNDPESHDGVITHLEPDMLECEAKWALGSISIYTKEVTKPMTFLLSPESYASYFLKLRKNT